MAIWLFQEETRKEEQMRRREEENAHLQKLEQERIVRERERRLEENRKKKNNVRLKLRTETHFILLRSSPIVINVTNQTSPFKGFSNVDELSV